MQTFVITYKKCGWSHICVYTDTYNKWNTNKSLPVLLYFKDLFLYFVTLCLPLSLCVSFCVTDDSSLAVAATAVLAAEPIWLASLARGWTTGLTGAKVRFSLSVCLCLCVHRDAFVHLVQGVSTDEVCMLGYSRNGTKRYRKNPSVHLRIWSCVLVLCGGMWEVCAEPAADWREVEVRRVLFRAIDILQIERASCPGFVAEVLNASGNQIPLHVL